MPSSVPIATSSSKMLALRVLTSGADGPTLSLVAKPQPKPGMAVVKILAAGINPSDVLNAKGGFRHAKLPRTLGRDYAGVVEAGPEAWLGVHVYGTSGGSLSFEQDGTHAEYCEIPVDCLAIKPSNLNHAQAATVGVPFTTAALALNRAQLKHEDVVLVTGASGSVGSAVCQLARQMGCTVMTAARHGSVDVNLSTDPQMAAARRLTAGRGPDVVVDTTGSPAVVSAALLSLAPGGRLSYIAAPREGSRDLTFDMQHLYREQKTIVGCNSVAEDQVKTSVALREMTVAFENGALIAERVDDLEQISIQDAAMKYLEAKRSRGKKCVIVF